MTRYVEGLTDGATYYVVASTNQTNLQGNTRFTERQVIGLAELENESRAGVMIDIGPMKGSGYMLSAKHVLDSGFATGLGVVSQLTATNSATASAGLTSEDRNPTPWTKFLDVVGTNVPDLIFSKLTETFANVAGATPLSVTGALAFSYIDHDVLTDVGSRAVLKSNEDLEVRAIINQRYTLGAESAIEPQEDPFAGENQPAIGVSVAVNIGIFNNTALVTIHSEQTPNGLQAATLDALRVTRIGLTSLTRS